MTKNEYNGWFNYETWLIALWIDNEEGSSDYWNEAAATALEEAKDTLSANARLTGHEPFTTEEKATFALERQLKESFEESQPELDGFWADLLSAALSEINWHEVAAHYIDNAAETAETD